MASRKNFILIQKTEVLFSVNCVMRSSSLEQDKKKPKMIKLYNGVPNGAIAWLWENIVPGNVNYLLRDERQIRKIKLDTDKWFFERKGELLDAIRTRYEVDTFTFTDEKDAILFSLRWL